ncbi:MAG: hypothetical protein N3F63_06925 [Thermoplasmata archaeon]|nr:hypothetical protein [Thermoplasmata archaeon]
MTGTCAVLEKIREIVVDAAGPIADFVIKKQIRDLGYTADNFPQEKLHILIDRVVDNAIYDKEKKELVRSKLRRLLHHRSNSL